MAESQNIEYKESWRDEYLKWVCGFANAQGGTIYIGIDDAGNVVGVQNVKSCWRIFRIRFRRFLELFPMSIKRQRMARIMWRSV